MRIYEDHIKDLIISEGLFPPSGIGTKSQKSKPGDWLFFEPKVLWHTRAAKTFCQRSIYISLTYFLFFF